MVEGGGVHDLSGGVVLRFADGGESGLLKRLPEENTKVWETFVFWAGSDGFQAVGGWLPRTAGGRRAGLCGWRWGGVLRCSPGENAKVWETFVFWAATGGSNRVRLGEALGAPGEVMGEVEYLRAGIFRQPIH